jgi:hypothetical protein
MKFDKDLNNLMMIKEAEKEEVYQEMKMLRQCLKFTDQIKCNVGVKFFFLKWTFLAKLKRIMAISSAFDMQ